jgi:hypothetical protein
LGVFFLNGIGDHLMTLPALRSLVHVLPPRVVLFVIPELQRVVLSELAVAGTAPLSLSTPKGRHRFELENAGSLPKGMDLFVSLNPWHSVEVDDLLQSLRPALSVGMDEAFDVCVRAARLEHSSDRAFRIARVFDSSLCIDDFSDAPRLPDSALAAAQSILEELPRHCRLLTVHNETLPHKVWSDMRLATVLRAFLSSHEDVVGISVDSESERLSLKISHPRLISVRSLPLDVALALVSLSDLFLGVDSCMLHMADLCRVPGVGLFGPKELAPLGSSEMGFRFGPHRHVSGHGSMDRIRASAVLTALEELTPRRPGLARRHGLAGPQRSAGQYSLDSALNERS